MRSQARARLYGVAESQAGYFTTAQAQVAGVSRQTLHYLERHGHLMRIRTGLYRLEQFPSQAHEDLMAALLVVGDDAAVSHESALVVWRLSDAMPARIHLTRPRRWQGRSRGIVVHVADLADDEVTGQDGVRVTSLGRTLTDVAPRDVRLAEQALREGLETGTLPRREFARLVERYPGLRSLVANVAP